MQPQPKAKFSLFKQRPEGNQVKYKSLQKISFSNFPKFSKEFLPLNMPIIEWLKTYAAKKGATPSQIALAWLLAKSESIVPIPGNRYEAHLLENLGSINFRLTKDDVQEIETSLSKFPVYGDRMGEAHMSQIDYTV